MALPVEYLLPHFDIVGVMVGLLVSSYVFSLSLFFIAIYILLLVPESLFLLVGRGKCWVTPINSPVHQLTGTRSWTSCRTAIIIFRLRSSTLTCVEVTGFLEPITMERCARSLPDSLVTYQILSQTANVNLSHSIGWTLWISQYSLKCSNFVHIRCNNSVLGKGGLLYAPSPPLTGSQHSLFSSSSLQMLGHSAIFWHRYVPNKKRFQLASPPIHCFDPQNINYGKEYLGFRVEHTDTQL